MERENIRRRNISKNTAAGLILGGLLAGGCSDVRPEFGQDCKPGVRTEALGSYSTSRRLNGEPAIYNSTENPAILYLKPLPYYKSFFGETYDRAQKEDVLEKPSLANAERMGKANVRLVVDTPTDVDRFCNGVHIGRGRIATAAHCVEGYAPGELKVTIFDANGREHEGSTVSNIPGLDAAVIRTSEQDYPGESTLGDALKLVPNSYVSMYASEQPGSASYNALYMGGYRNMAVEGCDNDSANYQFIMLTGENNAKLGHSGSGIYDPKNGELVGIFTSIIHTPTPSPEAIEGVRSEVIANINRANMPD